MTGPNGQPCDPTPIFTRVLLQAGQIEPPVLLSWPEPQMSPIAMVTCPECGWRTSRRAAAWTRTGLVLTWVRFVCFTPGCGRTFSVFDWHPLVGSEVRAS